MLNILGTTLSTINFMKSNTDEVFLMKIKISELRFVWSVRYTLDFKDSIKIKKK